MTRPGFRHRVVPAIDTVGDLERLQRQASCARESATRPAIQRAELRAMGLSEDACYPVRPTFQGRTLS